MTVLNNSTIHKSPEAEYLILVPSAILTNTANMHKDPYLGAVPSLTCAHQRMHRGAAAPLSYTPEVRLNDTTVGILRLAGCSVAAFVCEPFDLVMQLF